MLVSTPIARKTYGVHCRARSRSRSARPSSSPAGGRAPPVDPHLFATYGGLPRWVRSNPALPADSPLVTVRQTKPTSGAIAPSFRLARRVGKPGWAPATLVLGTAKRVCSKVDGAAILLVGQEAAVADIGLIC
jgi:hypothetical protein